ncbi:hypothetical protein DPEC_G00333160 [Dallia pectoralis]|uniref:Uncharacterized protein n=1 Tax=Dallia pectoralis TaxID=75939 RepID=A0ACC2F6G0_DALPE|nr:hypothetical protein DPEC_G00333160 [Dallia pectoralis]
MHLRRVCDAYSPFTPRRHRRGRLPSILRPARTAPFPGLGRGAETEDAVDFTDSVKWNSDNLRFFNPPLLLMAFAPLSPLPALMNATWDNESRPETQRDPGYRGTFVFDPGRATLTSKAL